MAPKKSLRPVARKTPEERKLADERARQREMAEAFASLEARADLDPYFEDNPIARLGWRERGGLRNVDYLPYLPDDGMHFPEGFGSDDFNDPMTPDLIRSLAATEPERVEAFENYESDYLMPPGAIGIGPNYYADPILAHEFGHLGYDILQNEFPDFRERLFSERLPPKTSYGFEEAMIEMKDDPEASWNRPDGEEATLEHTIQYLNSDMDIPMKERIEQYQNVLEQLAIEELARRGEPPRAQMRKPPQKERGVGALFRSLFGMEN